MLVLFVVSAGITAVTAVAVFVQVVVFVVADRIAVIYFQLLKNQVYFQLLKLDHVYSFIGRYIQHEVP